VVVKWQGLGSSLEDGGVYRGFQSTGLNVDDGRRRVAANTEETRSDGRGQINGNTGIIYRLKVNIDHSNPLAGLQMTGRRGRRVAA